MKYQWQAVGDVADLPTHAYGPRSVTWWGMVGFIAIEGTVFVLSAATYFYLMNQEAHWPPQPLRAPDLLFGTLFTVALLATDALNIWLHKVAEAEERRLVLLGLVATVAAGLVLLVLRAFEFTALNVRWDTNAYGSIVWIIMGLHTIHLLTDYVDTAVLAALMFTAHGTEGRRFVDVSENCAYWHFVVISWLAIYAIVYWAPRLA